VDSWCVKRDASLLVAQQTLDFAAAALQVRFRCCLLRRRCDGLSAWSAQDRGDAAAENGATVAELEAIFTWTGGKKMASLYAQAADKRRLAKRAMHKLAEQRWKSIVAP
jgi:hypothetical protein